MWRFPVLLCLASVCSSCVDSKYVGEVCSLKDYDGFGECTRIDNCKAGLEALKHRKPHGHGLLRCGFDRFTEVVCCPAENRFGPPDIKQVGQIAKRECDRYFATLLPPTGFNIIGGKKASSGQFPHMAALGYYDSGGIQFYCGGSLISASYILTAAHCIVNVGRSEPSFARMGVVAIGKKQYDSNTDYNISRIIVHPEYVLPAKYNDIALLRLSSQVNFTGNLRPICLHTSLDDPKTPLSVTGWGVVDTRNNIRSDELMHAQLAVLPVSDCSRYYTIPGSKSILPRGIIQQQICAGDREGTKDACEGDSGGPLQDMTSPDAQYRIVGITSFGRGCGNTNPGVYTRVASYVEWIENTVWPSS